MTSEHRHQITGVNPTPPFVCTCGVVWSVEREKWIEPMKKVQA